LGDEEGGEDWKVGVSRGALPICEVKSPGVWEATHPITYGLPPGGMLNGFFYTTSSSTTLPDRAITTQGSMKMLADMIYT
jgi:hypothetical protein